MYCGKCGMPLAYGKTECSICGYDENQNNKKNSSNKKLIIGLIIGILAVIFIFVGLLLFYVGISSTSSMVNKAKTNSAISNYNITKKQVIMKYAEGENIICDDNCNLYFDIQSTDFEIEVETYGNDYKLILELEDHFLGKDKLDKKICSERNLVCTDDEIIGIISFDE